jgi:predicted outer membrane repeat protein
MQISGCSQHAINITATAGNSAPVTLRRISLVNNTGLQGAALNIVANVSVRMEGCVVEDTDASAYGSAIHAGAGSQLVLLDTVVQDTNGSGLHFNGKDLLVIKSSFRKNTARTCPNSQKATYGGAIFAAALQGSEQVQVNITNSTFDSNTACFGGAVAVDADTKIACIQLQLHGQQCHSGRCCHGFQRKLLGVHPQQCFCR